MTASRLTHGDPTVQASHPSTLLLVRLGVIAGAAAAAATTTTAALARSGGVALQVNGATIPTGAFAMWTIVGAALGVILARILSDRRRFVKVTLAATALSLIPAVALPDDLATKAVLVAAHLLAAAIIISTLSQPLAASASPGAHNR